MIEATQAVSAAVSAGPVASAPVASDGVTGRRDTGEFGRTLEARVREGAGKAHGEEAGAATRAKGKGQAAGEKRAGEHKSVQLQAGVEAAGDMGEAQAAAPASAVGVAAVIAAAVDAPKLAGQVMDADGGNVTAKASTRPVGVAVPAAAVVLPAPAGAATVSDAGTNVPVAGLRAGLAVQAEIAKVAALPAAEAAPVLVAPSAAVQGGGATVHGSAKEGAPVAGAKVDAEPVVRADEARVFEASPGALEVGVANSTHGWLRVRAEVDDGGAVVAQVLAANTTAAEGLHKELPALSAFLAHEQVGVSSLVVHAPASAAGAQDAALNFAQDRFAQGQGSSARSGGEKEKSSAGSGVADNQEIANGLGTVLNLPSQFGGGILHGGWLSVRV